MADGQASDDLAGWERTVRASYLAAYLERAGRPVFLPAAEEATRGVLRALELEKAAYELQYELNNRPDWVEIPLVALAQLTG